MWLKTESWTYPYFKNLIPVKLKRNQSLKLECPSSSGVHHLSRFCQHSLEVALVFLRSWRLRLCQPLSLCGEAISRARGPDLNCSQLQLCHCWISSSICIMSRAVHEAPLAAILSLKKKWVQWLSLMLLNFVAGANGAGLIRVVLDSLDVADAQIK